MPYARLQARLAVERGDDARPEYEAVLDLSGRHGFYDPPHFCKRQRVHVFRLCEASHNRKAWLFADTPAGAKASAAWYSLIESAKANGLEPYAYLQHVIGNIAAADTHEQREALLPWNVR